MTQNKNIKVSVIVPIYNVEEYIKECIDSIINQTYKNLEIILVNDGSKDKSIEIVNEYEDSRIKIITKENGGLSSARNRGIEEATGEYIFHVDGDDFIETNVIKNLVNKLNKYDEDIDVIVGDLTLWTTNTKKVWKDSLLNEGQIYTGKQYLEEHFFVGKGCYSSCNKLWKRSLYIDNGIRHPLEISLGEDSNTVVRLMYNAKKIVKLNMSIYNYRINPNSMTKLKNKKLIEYKKSIEILKKYFSMKNDSNFFQYYELAYTFFTLYSQVLTFSYKYLKLNKMTNYIEIKDLLKKDIKKVNNEKLIMKNINIKQKILLKLLNLNFNTGDKILEIKNKI